jgi:16S rRNA (cytosine967-C5)-methyltransferase
MLKKGGMLVYSTCSVLPSENEKQVEKFIGDQDGAFQLEEQKIVMPSEGYDGFFMARIKKV